MVTLVKSTRSRPRERTTRRILIFSASFGGGHQSAAEAMEAYIRQHHPRTVDVRIVDFFKEFAPALNSLGQGALRRFGAHGARALRRLLRGHEPHLGQPDGQGLRTGRLQPGGRVHRQLRAGRGHLHVPGRRRRRVADPAHTADHLRDGDHGLRGPPSVAPPGDGPALRGRRGHPCGSARAGHRPDRVVASGIPITRAVRRAARPATRAARSSVSRTASPPCSRWRPGRRATCATSPRRSSASDIQVVAVTGRAERLKRRLQTLQRRQPLLHVYGFTREMHRIMCASDVLIGKAGGLDRFGGSGGRPAAHRAQSGAGSGDVQRRLPRQPRRRVPGPRRGRRGQQGRLPVQAPGPARSRWPDAARRAGQARRGPDVIERVLAEVAASYGPAR